MRRTVGVRTFGLVGYSRMAYAVTCSRFLHPAATDTPSELGSSFLRLPGSSNPCSSLPMSNRVPALLTLSVLPDGRVEITPGESFGPEHAPFMTAAAVALKDVVELHTEPWSGTIGNGFGEARGQ